MCGWLKGAREDWGLLLEYIIFRVVVVSTAGSNHKLIDDGMQARVHCVKCVHRYVSIRRRVPLNELMECNLNFRNDRP